MLLRLLNFYSLRRSNMLESLLDLFTLSTDENYTHGLRWYKKANSICKKLSVKHDIPLYKVVGIMAALSPRNKWERNIIDTESVIVSGFKAKVCTFNPNKLKAVKILNSGDKDEVFRLLNGRKVQSFYNNILMHKLSSTVTVDVWAMRSVGLNRAPNKGLYDQVEIAYKQLAEIVGIKPHEIQAVIWGVVRNG